MIIMDLSQVSHAAFSVHVLQNKNKVESDIVRHMILNSIRMCNVKFRAQYGEMILATDGKNSWRREVFPYYKKVRSTERELNRDKWDLFHQILNDLKEDIKQYFPYRMINVDHAEADDVIGTLCSVYGTTDPFVPTEQRILIISSDKDFKQLQKYSNVDQFCPRTKTFIHENDPQSFLYEHIVKGDAGDGIPNIRSDDDTFINENKRQPPINKSYIGRLAVFDVPPDDIDRMERNRLLIDLSMTPKNIQENIIAEFEKEGGKTKKKLMTYFTKNRMKIMFEHIGDF